MVKLVHITGATQSIGTNCFYTHVCIANEESHQSRVFYVSLVMTIPFDSAESNSPNIKQPCHYYVRLKFNQCLIINAWMFQN